MPGEHRPQADAGQRIAGRENFVRELVEAASGVLVTTSRTMSTTSTIVTGGGRALLVDPAWHPDELAGLADALGANAIRVTAGFATHAHHDHLLWHPRFGDAPRWASPRTAELARAERATLLGYLGQDFPPPLADLLGRVSAVEGEIPVADLPAGIRAELVIHDGHVPGHAAVWLAGQRVLIAGDMLSEKEVPLPFHPDDLPSYLDGLDRLAPYVARAAVLIPGHGTPTRAPMARLEADRRYLDAVMRGRMPDDPRLADPEMLGHYEHLAAMVAGSS
jgi:glyoxylase-like metal-dependent hydrolase (beta-lactamase superfamily II)